MSLLMSKVSLVPVPPPLKVASLTLVIAPPIVISPVPSLSLSVVTINVPSDVSLSDNAPMVMVPSASKVKSAAVPPAPSSATVPKLMSPSLFASRVTKLSPLSSVRATAVDKFPVEVIVRAAEASRLIPLKFCKVIVPAEVISPFKSSAEELSPPSIIKAPMSLSPPP